MYCFIAYRMLDIHDVILSLDRQREMRAGIQNEENSIAKAQRVRGPILCYKTLGHQPSWAVGLGLNE